ncbi:AraC family transcriptional regulator [Alcanivorax nanhaiticus]|uniref:AraC family transcriptional regulator n=1 Tax=Alcanivorax nanhaiticus TaxID=1177154 RepID=A0A095SKL4_9GAMM|nr:AraC family transcriptional regulator [Alcanivorax nanhaiticus]KGD64884.1 AraC family transcriptional regulator [Alcanivorax nanhaiticus]
MDKDSPCIPLGHIQTYFDLRKSLNLDADWLQQKIQFHVDNPHEIIEHIIGIDQASFYRNAGIDYLPGEDGRFINTRQVVALVDQAVQALRMPYLGLTMGNLMTISHHGMAGVAAVTQTTLRECLEVISRFCDELFPPLSMNGYLEKGEGKFFIREEISLAPYTHFFIELNMVSFYNIMEKLIGSHDYTKHVTFAYPEPAWGNIYRRYFKCPVIFDQPENAIVGCESLAERELPLANRLMAMSAEKSLFENIPTRAMRILPLRLRRMLMRYYGAFPSLENAASELGMSGRTMRRKLAENGTSYQKELDNVRQKLAREYFSRGGESITELALMLGFTDSSAFAKAFRRWTGLSPTEFLAEKEATAKAHRQ